MYLLCNLIQGLCSWVYWLLVCVLWIPGDIAYLDKTQFSLKTFLLICNELIFLFDSCRGLNNGSFVNRRAIIFEFPVIYSWVALLLSSVGINAHIFYLVAFAGVWWLSDNLMNHPAFQNTKLQQRGLINLWSWLLNPLERRLCPRARQNLYSKIRILAK